MKIDPLHTLKCLVDRLVVRSNNRTIERLTNSRTHYLTDWLNVSLTAFGTTKMNMGFTDDLTAVIAGCLCHCLTPLPTVCLSYLLRDKVTKCQKWWLTGNCSVWYLPEPDCTTDRLIGDSADWLIVVRPDGQPTKKFIIYWLPDWLFDRRPANQLTLWLRHTYHQINLLTEWPTDLQQTNRLNGTHIFTDSVIDWQTQRLTSLTIHWVIEDPTGKPADLKTGRLVHGLKDRPTDWPTY